MRTILLIEDNLGDRLLTIRAFQKAGITNPLVTMNDGVEACDYLLPAEDTAVCSPLPAVILLDLNMPRLNGFDVLRRLRSHERTRNLPVIVLTSSREEQDIVNSYALGANSYIQKPVDFDRFVDAAKQLAHYWLSLNEVPGTLDDSTSHSA
jgi:two-component system, response regulator